MTLEECVDWVAASRQDAGDGRVETALRKTIKELEGALKKRDTTVQRRDKTVADLRKRVDVLEKDKKKMKEDQKKMKEDQSTLRKRVAALEKDQAEAERRAKTKPPPAKKRKGAEAEPTLGPPPRKSKAQQKKDVEDCPFSKLTLHVPGIYDYVFSKPPECNGYYKVEDVRQSEFIPATVHIGPGIGRTLRFGPSVETKASWDMDDMESDDDSYHGPWPLNGEFDGEGAAGRLTYSQLTDRYYEVGGKSGLRAGEEFEMIAWTPGRDCRVVFAVKANEKGPDSFDLKFVSAEVVLGDKASCERFVREIVNSMD